MPFHFDLYAMTIFCSGVKTLFPPDPPLGAAETAAVVAAAAAAEAIMEAVLNEVRAVPAATSVVGRPKLVGRMSDAAVSVAMLAVLTAVMIPGAGMFVVVESRCMGHEILLGGVCLFASRSDGKKGTQICEIAGNVL